EGRLPARTDHPRRASPGGTEDPAGDLGQALLLRDDPPAIPGNERKPGRTSSAPAPHRLPPALEGLHPQPGSRGWVPPLPRRQIYRRVAGLVEREDRRDRRSWNVRQRPWSSREIRPDPDR